MLKVPRIIISVLIISTLSFLLLTNINLPVYSNTVSELEEEIARKEREIEEKESVLQNVERRIKEISGSNYSVSQKISLLTEEISILEKNIAEKEEEIEGKVLAINEKQEQLAKTKVLIDEVSGDLYIQSRYKMTNFFLDRNNWGNIVEGIFIRKSVISVLRLEIEKMGGEFSSLAESKAELDKEMDGLSTQREGLDEAHKLLADERAKLQAELSKQVASKSGLSSEITDLSKKVSQLQEALIAARSAGLISSGGYTGTEDGTSISQAPGGYFGVFSIGAYTHRNGMSQWGARARADAGQNVNQILGFYYPSFPLNTNYPEPVAIRVFGSGLSCYCQAYRADGSCASYERYYDEIIPFDTYMNRIYEMPASWNVEVLKAQAIAARTFAIYKVNTQGYIIPNQNNQVSKDCDNAPGWINAVALTKNQVLISGGTATLVQYAAVHGGWINNVGWDTQSNGGSNWFNDSWDRISGVTWFYKSWYRAGYTSGGEACGKSPWVSGQEMVDFINAYFVKNSIGLKATPDKSRILPSDYGKCPGRLDYGRTDKVPYSSAELKSFLSSPVNSISSVSTSLINGFTTNVSFNTDRGVVNIAGMSFKDIYNQIAPGHMRIQQQSSYGYFNVEKR